MKKMISSLVAVIVAIGIIGCTPKKEEVKKEAPVSKITELKSLSDLKAMPQFKVDDIKGKEITEDIFKDYKITMVNIWGTFCGPCVAEMSDLQQLYSEMKAQGVNVMGVISDGNEQKELAKKIISEKRVTYTNIIPNEDFYEKFVSTTEYVPATVFVNSKGEIIGETVVGGRKKEEYKAIVTALLKDTK